MRRALGVLLLGLALGGSLATTGCSSGPDLANDLVEEHGNQRGIWSYFARCNKEHNGLWNGWESPRTESRNQASDWAKEHNDEWGHDARVRRTRKR